MGRWNDRTIIPPSDDPIIMIGNKTLGQWVDGLTIGHFKLFFTELLLK